MKAAVVITVLNEAGTLAELFESLADQTRPADEIFLVDGGSQDATLQVAESYSTRLPALRILSLPGSNISQGRNHGIASACSPLIATTDAGCQPAPNWLERLLAPLQGETGCDMVAGAVLPLARDHLEACIACCSLSFRIQLGGFSLFPTARSLAFRRSSWEKAGGFPEQLDYGEDTAFMLSAVRSGARLDYQPEALVHWRPRRTYRQVISQFYCYADGLGQAGLSRQFHLLTLAQSAAGWILILLGIASRSWIPWALLLALMLAYFARKARQGCFNIPTWRTFYRVPLVLAAIHIGTVAGALHGNWVRIRYKGSHARSAGE